MNRYRSLVMVTCLIGTIVYLFNVASSLKAAEPPEFVTMDMLADLYEPVVFDHAMHMENYSCGMCHHHTMGEEVQRESCRRCHDVPTQLEDGSCTGCHAVEVGTDEEHKNIYHIDKPGLKGVLHLQCVGCHKEESGPVGCTECHEFTAKGRKRFGLGLLK